MVDFVLKFLVFCLIFVEILKNIFCPGYLNWVFGSYSYVFFGGFLVFDFGFYKR